MALQFHVAPPVSSASGPIGITTTLAPSAPIERGSSCIIKYLELQEEFESRYNDRAIVWMQIGDFYEMYEYDPANCEHKERRISRHRPGYIYDKPIGQITDVALILDDMTITMQDNNRDYSIDNPNKAGFPIRAYKSKLKTLLYHNYVVIRVDQINPAHLHKYRPEEVFYVNKNSEPRRIAEIASRATALDTGLPPTVTNNIVSIYIEYQGPRMAPRSQKLFERSVVTCGISCIDVTTGINLVSELHAKEYNHGAAIQEITRFMLAQQPREVVVNVSNLPTAYGGPDDRIPGPYARFLIELFELDKCVNFVILINKVKPEYSKLSYQGQFFNKVFFNLDNSSGLTISSVTTTPGSARSSSMTSSSARSSSAGLTFSFKPEKTAKNIYSQPPGPGSSSASHPIFTAPLPSHSEPTRAERVKTLHSNSMVLSKLALEDMSYGRISYMLLLQYCYEHSSHLIKRVKSPDTTWIDAKRHLTLTHNAIDQLNIAPETGFNYRRNTNLHSLFDVLNFTRTRMGYRRLRDRLFNPLLNAPELNRSYQMIEDMNDALLNEINLILKGMPDIDNYYRKIMLATLKPRELVIIYQAYVRITKLYGLIHGCPSEVLKTVLFTGSAADEFNQFLSDAFNTFDLEKLKECTIITDDKTKVMDFPHAPIKSGAAPELDDLIRSITYYEQALQAVCDHLNGFLTRSRGAKIDYHRKSNEKGKRDKILGIDILTTQAKARTIQQNIGSIDRSICGDIRIETFHSQRRITSEYIGGLITGLESCKNQLRVKLLQVYYDLLERASNLTFYDAISDTVATLDFIQAGRTAANKYKYYRPSIVESECSLTSDVAGTASSSGTSVDVVSDSYLRVTGLRHPIIERIIDQPYITNDVQLGTGPAGDQIVEANRGLLVYGANSTGKTTLARATALAVIMAQAGLYTAGQLSYRVFHKIFTRIGGNDDSNKGRSSFVVEMCEIQIPVSDADNRSLIFGDEPCRGTERFSGVGIAAKTIAVLLERKACFIMATHLHDMLDLPSFQSLKPELQIGHLNMHHDSTIGDLVIDRKLRSGSGPTIYGIEVAKSLGFSDEFIRGAMQFRAEAVQISTEIVPTARSRYNSRVYKDACLLCGSQSELHTHHLVPQKAADERGFIGDMPKDLPGNLVTLCQTCHHRIHHDDLALKSVETVSGAALILESIDPIKREE